MSPRDAGSPPYPLEPIRSRYVAPFAGVSYELAPGEVGLSEEAISANTRLTEDAEVLVSATASPPGAPHLPLAARPFYRVVPLGAARPHARRLSPRGEIVFSSYELDAPATSLLPWLRPGDAVVLNAALARLGRL